MRVFLAHVARHPLFAMTLMTLALLLAWDASGLDLVLARMAGTSAGFPWRDNWWLVKVMHEGARSASWAWIVALSAGVRWPVGPLCRLETTERLQLAGTVIASVIAISAVKNLSDSSCPWDLQVFGGVAQYVSHWSWGVRDGGPGGCFPAGHASAGFAYVGGYFALRRALPEVARRWLGCALAAGLVLGVGQQLRGAHYMSHTLWTAWFCWLTGYVVDTALRKLTAWRNTRHARHSMQTVPKLNES